MELASLEKLLCCLEPWTGPKLQLFYKQLFERSAGEDILITKTDCELFEDTIKIQFLPKISCLPPAPIKMLYHPGL